MRSILVEPVPFSDDHPAFDLIQRRMTRARYFHIWRRNLFIRSRGPAQMVARLDSITRQRTHFRRWRQARSSVAESDVSRIDPKYVEFMAELQRTLQSIARLQTTSDVLAARISELSDLYEQTREKARSGQAAFDHETEKYETLLRSVAEKKLEHRDQVAALQMRIGERRRGKRGSAPKSIANAGVAAKLAEERDKFQSRMREVREKVGTLKEKATKLRVEFEESERANREFETEIESLGKTKAVLEKAEERFLVVPPDSETARLRKLLRSADQHLKESAQMVENKALEIKELDYQIIRHRKILADLKGKVKL
jgi:chromosome segregation ATPase